MLSTKLLKRQLQQLFELDTESLQTVLADLQQLAQQSQHPSSQKILTGFGDFLQKVDSAYAQSQRDLELRSRSLELSSQELNWSNQRLAIELKAQQVAIQDLKSVARLLSGRMNFSYNDTDGTLQSTTQLLTHLGETLHLSQERLQLALSSAEIGLWDWQGQDNSLYCSEQFYALLGLNAHQVSSSIDTWTTWIHPQQQQLFIQATHDLFTGAQETLDIEVQMRHQNGHFLWMQIQGKATQQQPDIQPRRCLGTLININNRKTSQVAILEAKEAAEASNKAKSDFLANVSHEIRTPMNGIIGMTKLCLETPLNAEQSEYLDMVLSSAMSLLNLINDVLDFSKIEAGKIVLDSIDFNIRKLVRDCLRPLALRAQEKGLELICDISNQVPSSFIGDPNRLRRIIINLIGNAIKFTEYGEVSLKIDAQQDKHLYLLNISVSDTGIGIPAHLLDKIFESFSQGDSSITRRYGGTGLGLAISSNLVQLMGGRINVSSLVQQGSTFSFSIPLALGHEQQITLAAPETIHHLPVLVVDDNATNRRLMHDMLYNFGMEPVVVYDARHAMLKLIDHALENQPFKLVLLDAQMPDCDGFTLAQDILHNPKLGKPAVIMLSSIANPPNSTTLKEMGISDFLNKPIDQSELYNCILATLGNNELTLSRGVDKSQHTASHRTQTRHRFNRQLHILLAEDNTINQRLAMRLLHNMGHNVTLAHDGLEALNAVMTHTYDVVLMDIQMPTMGGIIATERIREWSQQHQKPHLPIIAMTAHAMQGDKEKFLAVGMDGYVSKPISTDELAAELSRVSQHATTDFHSETDTTLAINTTLEHNAMTTLSDKAPEICFDYELALENMGGDPSFVLELAQIFIKENPERMALLKQAVLSKNAEQIYLIAHKLKGESANFGRPQIEHIAEELSNMGRNKQLDSVDSLFAQLEAGVASFIADLQHRVIR